MILEVCAVLSTTFLCCNTCLMCIQTTGVISILERMEGVNCKLERLNELTYDNTQLNLRERQERRKELFGRSCLAGLRVELPRETETLVEALA